jgi:hypothetical protein
MPQSGRMSSNWLHLKYCYTVKMSFFLLLKGPLLFILRASVSLTEMCFVDSLKARDTAAYDLEFLFLAKCCKKVKLKIKKFEKQPILRLSVVRSEKVKITRFVYLVFIV